MLTSQKILDLVLRVGTAGAAGAAEAARRHGLMRMNSAGVSYDSGPQADFVKAVATTPTRPRPSAYLHPEQAAGSGADHKQEPLSPADMLWLQRLPQDPSKITFDDAVVLAKFANTYASMPREGGNAPKADKRLIDSIWAPVKSFHDRHQAEVALQRAKVPLPEIPSSALGALADAIRQEVPALTDDEALTRASNVLRETLDQRAQKWETALGYAQADIAVIESGVAEKSVVTRNEDGPTSSRSGGTEDAWAMVGREMVEGDRLRAAANAEPARSFTPTF